MLGCKTCQPVLNWSLPSRLSQTCICHDALIFDTLYYPKPHDWADALSKGLGGINPSAVGALCKGLGGLNPLAASLVPPWCLTDCPISPFLHPWCLPGASQIVPLVLSCLPGLPWCLSSFPNGPCLPPWCLPGAFPVSWCLPGALQIILSCLPGASLVPHRLSNWSFPASLVPPWSFPISPTQFLGGRPSCLPMALSSLPGCPISLPPPPGLSKSVSGAFQAIETAFLLPYGLSVFGASQALQMALWSLPGRPNSSRGPSGASGLTDFSGVGRAVQMALSNGSLEPPGPPAQIAKHLTKGHRGPASASLKVTGNEKGRARFCPKCVHFTRNFAKRGPNPRPHEIFNPASTSLKVTGDKKGCTRFCAECVHFTMNFAKQGPNPRPHARDAIEPFCDFRSQNCLNGSVAAILPFHKFLWPPIGRAAMPHSQNLNGRIHAHSFPRLLSFFGSAATPCSVAGVAASPFLCTCRLCIICSFVCLPYLGTGLGKAAMQSMGAREGRKKGQEPARRLRATLNPKRVVFGWPWGGLVRNVMACAMGRGGVKK